ncbi:MAG TPA: ABC transporter ATP-binding protein [Bacteroidales bacterium]|nr:ABC transporter ATP-binding protein [Bacteroidales bacterium]
MNSTAILSFCNLLIGFYKDKKRTSLLPPLSASAGKGELISVIGRNGIGKSTLLRTISGIQNKTGGVIYLNNKELFSYSRNELARISGFISTENIKVSNMNVFDLISLGRHPYTNWIGNLTEIDHLIISNAIDRTSVSDLKFRYISELSDGERQKTMIARLIAQDTSVMIMDEPTAFLDVRSKFEILHLMYSLTRQEGKTIIFSTHDLNIALKHSDKIWLILEDGITEGAPEDLMIKGKFDHLFESSSVKFNSDDGSYSFGDKIDRGQIKVSGEGTKRHWTEQALQRAGFNIVRSMASITIKVDESKWIISDGTAEKECYSIYDMVNELNAGI